MMKKPIKPYGDTLNDGWVQLSFTLPVKNGPKAVKAAEMYVEHLRFERISVVHAAAIAPNFTFFVVYASAVPVIDYDRVQPVVRTVKKMTYDEINQTIRHILNRPLRVVGAAVGNDAHTVGIDAIMNMKGYDHDRGLESYPSIDAYNMGAQVSCRALMEKAVALNGDAVLVSRTVTQKQRHITVLKELVELFVNSGLRKRYILIAGGPGITHEAALDLGYDGGFGRGTYPSEAASFLAAELKKKHKDSTGGFLPKGGL